MKLIFKQRFFSWFDSYDIYDESGNTAYTVKGQLSWGHCLKISDANGNEVGTVKEKVFSFLPKFEMYLGDTYVGCISKEFTLFRPRFHIDCNGWRVEGDWFEWDYSIVDSHGHRIAVLPSMRKSVPGRIDTALSPKPSVKQRKYALKRRIFFDSKQKNAVEAKLSTAFSCSAFMGK